MADLMNYLLAKRYKISKRLGAGGMGEVWLATDTELGREVAIKFILPHYSQNQVARESFISEARLVAKLDHPYIMKIYDIGMESINHKMTIYLVMQYAANGTLSDKLKHGFLSLTETNRIMQQICQALDYAHQQLIIHLDIKPANILFDHHGNALVNDFGLARVLEKQTHVSLSRKSGTPAYMPPEQSLADKAGPFSDVFAVGVMLYQMVSGQLPRRRFEEQFEIHFDKPLTTAIQMVVTKATLTSSKQRYQSLKILAQELEQAIQVDAPLSQPVKPMTQSLSQTVPNTTQTKIAFDWVTIPAGEFIMGSDDKGDSEKPMHKFYLPEYQIARVPVTNEQWRVFLQDSDYQWANGDKLWQNGLPRGKEKHPIVSVTWYDAMAFCKWAGVRLPTEAEWEKAARGTDGRNYPWGNQEPITSLCNFNRNVGDTTEVGNYPQGASPNGCLDMAGNVWEWCSNEYAPYPYKANDGQKNNIKVLRGGAWGTQGYYVRASYRDRRSTTKWPELIGFRCVC